jgi:predicted Zn-dependent protease
VGLASRGWARTLPQPIHSLPRRKAGVHWFEMIGDVHLLQGRTDQAIIWLEKARNHTPAHSIIRADLAAAYGLAGERAVTELAEARRLSPRDRYSSLARLRKVENWECRKSALREATKFTGLRKAGMPEE